MGSQVGQVSDSIPVEVSGGGEPDRLASAAGIAVQDDGAELATLAHTRAVAEKEALACMHARTAVTEPDGRDPPATQFK